MPSYPTGGAAAPVLAGALAVTNVTQLIIAANTSRRVLLLHNLGPDTVYIGQSGIATTAGYPLTPGKDIDIQAAAAIYAVTTTTADLRWWEETRSA